MDTFSALAEPTRRDILLLLAKDGQLPASEIYRHFSVSHPAISQHLKILREAHWVEVEKKAQQRLYRINREKINELDSWIKQMTKLWEERFDALDQLLKREKQKLKKKEEHGK